MMDPSNITRSRRWRPTVTRALLLVTAAAWSLVAAYVVFGVSGWVAATPATVQAAAPAGTASVSGTVTSTAPFKAAQVSLRNVDKRILYMVTPTPGSFARSRSFPATTRSVSPPRASIRRSEGDVEGRRQPGGEARAPSSADPPRPWKSTSYEEIYPPGPGRDVAERTCIVCHGENFLPSRPATVAGWTSRVDFMQGKTLFDRPAGAYAEGLLTFRNSALRFSRQDREDLLAYMVKNFGPDAKPRTVRIEQEMPFDEAKLAKAMYIEYYLTPDPPGQATNSPEFNKLSASFVGRRTGQDVRFDQDGNVWLTDRGYPHRLVKLDPRTGQQKDFVLPDPKNGIHEVMVDRVGHALAAGAFGHAAVEHQAVARLQSQDREVRADDSARSRQRRAQPDQVDAVDSRSIRRTTSTSAGSWAAR